MLTTFGPSNLHSSKFSCFVKSPHNESAPYFSTKDQDDISDEVEMTFGVIGESSQGFNMF
jgi:hypothetical protein